MMSARLELPGQIQDGEESGNMKEERRLEVKRSEQETRMDATGASAANPVARQGAFLVTMHACHRRPTAK